MTGGNIGARLSTTPPCAIETHHQSQIEGGATVPQLSNPSVGYKGQKKRVAFTDIGSSEKHVKLGELDVSATINTRKILKPFRLDPQESKVNIKALASPAKKKGVRHL